MDNKELIDALKQQIETLNKLISAKDALIEELKLRTPVAIPYWQPYYVTVPNYYWQYHPATCNPMPNGTFTTADTKTNSGNGVAVGGNYFNSGSSNLLSVVNER